MLYTYLLVSVKLCQDLSLAGNQKGMTKGSGTRSGLLWEVERLLDELNGNLPQVLLLENVPQVHGKKNLDDFNQWLNKLKQLGYLNYWKDLNAKDYGIPQNRNRCFMVSILGDYYYEFPKPIPLNRYVDEFLEDSVEDKYYLSQKQIEQVINWHTIQKPIDNAIERERERVVPTITARCNVGLNYSNLYLKEDL